MVVSATHPTYCNVVKRGLIPVIKSLNDQDTSLCMVPRVIYPGYLIVHDSQGHMARIPNCAWFPGSYIQDISLCMTPRLP